MGEASLAAIPAPSGIRHDPETIAAVERGIASGAIQAEIAKATGVSIVTVERIVAENPHLRALRARAREAEANALVDEARAILDAPLDKVETPRLSAEVARAKNRAEFRLNLARVRDRDTYGDGPKVAITIGKVAVCFAKLSSPAPGQGGEEE